MVTAVGPAPTGKEGLPPEDTVAGLGAACTTGGMTLTSCRPMGHPRNPRTKAGQALTPKLRKTAGPVETDTTPRREAWQTSTHPGTAKFLVKRMSLRAVVGEIVSSGIRKNRKPTVLPADPEATRQLQEWLASEEYNLNGMQRDFRGADLSGGDFSNAWFTDAVLVGVRLAGASFYRADLQAADLTGADLTGADLVKANLDEAVLRSARLNGTDMVGASLYGTDASGASFRATRFLGASLIDTDMRGRT